MVHGLAIDRSMTGALVALIALPGLAVVVALNVSYYRYRRKLTLAERVAFDTDMHDHGQMW